MVAQLAEAVPAEPTLQAVALPLDDALEALAAAADELQRTLDDLRGRGEMIRPELHMLAERASKAAQAGTYYKRKHFPRASRLR